MDSKSGPYTRLECAGTQRKAAGITTDSDPKRKPSHQGWEKRFGKIQMCDTCNRRAPDFLLCCKVCPFYVCKTCVFGNMLEGDSRHSVEIAETDWRTTEPAPKRAIKRLRAATRAQPSNADTTSLVSVCPSPSIQHQTRLPSLRDLFPPGFFPAPTSATMPRRQPDGDEDEDYTPLSKRQKSLAQRASLEEEPSATDSQYPESRVDFELDAAYTAASYRPNPRRSATVAYDRISQTCRTPRHPRRVEQQEEQLSHCQQSESRRRIQQHPCAEELQTSRNHVTSEASRASCHAPFAGPQQQDHRHAPQTKVSSNAPVKPSPLSNMSLLRDFEHLPTELTATSGRPVRGAMARALDRMSNQNQAGSSSAVHPAGEDFRSDSRPAKSPISREQLRKQNLIMVLYRSIFDSKLKEFPSLMTFCPIPGTWQEPSPCAGPAPPLQSLNHNIPQRADFDAFHQHSLNSTLRMKTPYGGPAAPIPPVGYESYSFQNYPSTHKTNEYHSTAADVFGQAVPSLRTTPKYHPANDMTPEELQRYHNDRRLFVKMKAAWVDNDKILRLRDQKGDEEALQTLWNVAQVFRARNPFNPSAESVKWFVDKRAEILRPKGRSQRQGASSPAGEEGGGCGKVEGLLNATVAAEEMEVEPKPTNVDELVNELGNEQMPQAGNDNDDDDEHDADELAPAFRVLQQLEQQQQQQQHQQQQASVSPSSHSQDYDADVDTPETQSETDEQERYRRAHSEWTQSKGRFGVNDLLN